MEKYLIWSNEHGAWWGPNGSGYTKEITEAGFYSQAEAIAHCIGPLVGGIPQELPVRYQDMRQIFFD